MARIAWRYAAAATLSGIAAWSLVAHAAENIDQPTILANQPLNGASSRTGTITPRVGFPAHIYTASKDGLVKVTMETSNVKASDNGGVAWRPYVRVLAQSNAERNGEAWSSNGYRNGATASADVIIRAKRGEKFTIVATLGQHLEGGSRVNANYTVTVKE
jgi:hypothetical protein